jgi:glycerol-3-phosphate dehydrogenase
MSDPQKAERTPLRGTSNGGRPDVLVIGGGINGTAIARDAALRGLRVTLVEKGDLGEGTSSWNSRMITGGIRYLEHHDLRLVRESLREREILLHMAPHLVRPYPLLIPFFHHNRRSSKTLRMGMLAFDLLSADKSTPWHRPISRSRLKRNWAGLEADGLAGGALYYDAQAPWAERLSIENALAAREVGAEICTHTPATRLITEGDRVLGAWVRSNGEEYPIEAPITINAAGPWIDQVVGQSLEQMRLIGGTKGSHLVVRPFSGAPSTGVYYEAVSDGRAILVLPWHDRYIIGTTDRYFSGDPGAVVADDAEVEYLLAETNRLLPSAKLTGDDVLWSYCGVRPLPYVPDSSEAEVSRDHVIYEHGPQGRGLLSVIGGKLTTHRALAEQTVNKVARLLGVSGRWSKQSVTRKLPLPGGRTADWRGFCSRFIQDSGLPEATSKRLLAVYGTRAADVMALTTDRPQLRGEFAPNAIAAELAFAFRFELAGNLTDALLRRTMLGLTDEVGLDVVDAAAEVMVRDLDFSHQTVQQQVDDYRSRVQRFQPSVLRGADKEEVGTS